MGVFYFVGRLWQAVWPQVMPKSSDALKFGILGAANIAPMALIAPAKAHAEVIIQAVAARDRKKAEAFAKKHGIPEVRDSYQEIIDDPNIDCVFIPLPNGLHFEWAVRAIRAGKHVLLEKPSVSNGTEAEILFRLPELSQPNAPVLLEAFHYRFQPCWTLFRSFITPADVVYADARAAVPGFLFNKDDIRFNYSLSGGTMMDLGTYCFSTLRQVFDANPEECLSCETEAFTEGQQKNCDYTASAKFRFPNGGVGEAYASLKGPLLMKFPTVTVQHKEVAVADDKLPASQEKFRTREVKCWNFMFSIVYHRIDVVDTYVIRNKDDGKEVKKWTEKSFHKGYSWEESGFGRRPESWFSYLHQLDQFVNRVRGRETTHWVSAEDSIGQMKMIDSAYEKSGLGVRPTSTFR
ncbi:putative oxidoreductase [Thozetella sp. PMI_491]|nr:putative oxidoreductase [Thozetella sp. PMI_491]